MLLLAENDTSVSVTLISTAGLIILGIIGVWQVKVTNRAKSAANTAKDEARSNAEEAAVAAQMAKDYAAAMGVKDSLVAALEARVAYCEEVNKKLTERLDEAERREHENLVAQQAAGALERDYAQEIDQLRRELHLLRDHGR